MSFNAFEVLKTFEQYGMPLYTMLSATSMYNFMEDSFLPYVEYDPNDPNSYTPDLRFKDFPVKTTYNRVGNCCQIAWQEEYTDMRPETTVTTGFVGTTVLFTNIEDFRQWRGISKGSTLILMKANGAAIPTTVIDVNATSLELSRSITGEVGDRLVRGVTHGHIGNCDTEYFDQWTLGQSESVYSNFSRAHLSFELRVCDVNGNRVAYDYGYDLSDWLNREFSATVAGFKNALSLAMLFDTNTMGNGGEPGETMGIIPSLQRAQQAVNPTNDPNGRVFIHDFSDCCATAETDCDILESFRMNVIRPALLSNQYVGRDMVAWVNNAQLDSFWHMETAFKDVFGSSVVEVRQSDRQKVDTMVFHERRFHSFSIGGTQFKYKHMTILDYVFGETPIMIMFPEDYFVISQMPVESVRMSDDGFTAQMRSGSPRIEIVDGSDQIHQKTGVKDCYVFKGSFTWASLLYMLKSGARQIVYNLQSKQVCGATYCSSIFNPVTMDPAVECPENDCPVTLEPETLNYLDPQGVEDGNTADDSDPIILP